MNRAQLRDLLSAEHVRPDAFSPEGAYNDESYCLEPAPGGWAVFYFERGLRSGEQWFATEDEACQFLAQRLLADPGSRVRSDM